ncbi:MAG: NADH-quinone oxidoreductase subunit C, partial [Gemmatimonadota bacterium]
MNRFDQLGLRNRRTVPLSAVPAESIEGFRRTVIDAVVRGWRIVSLFGSPDAAGQTLLLAVLADDARGRLGATSTLVMESFPSLTPECPEAHLFEREIAEQCGVTPVGHPWLKPVRRHRPDHGAVPGRAVFDPDLYGFLQFSGEEVHEVAVGPVHAGIIEPGHFRFQAHGEEVLFLEIMLGYQHRGVERLLETMDRSRTMLVAESIAGDTVIGHAEGFAGAIEALAR